MKNLNKEIAEWIKQYCETYNIKSLVIGVSGGIDSALVSTLCANTGIKTYCVLLPLHQKPEQTERGDAHVDWLMSFSPNVEKLTIDLTQAFDMFKTSMPDSVDNELAYANSKSRLRMTTLYQVAQAHGGIVVGTGNKVEDFGVGFFTKYGDGGVDISPIADLYKSQVYDLAKELGINPDIIAAKPTDGLWDDDRDDETQIGAEYPELEWAMKHLESDEDNSFLSDRQLEVLRIFEGFNKRNKHKMESIPVFKVK